MEKTHPILELAKNRGFLWPAYELYGQVAGFYDYGPHGAALKRRIEDAFRRLYLAEGYLEVENPIVAPEEVFIASGHAGHFTDPMAECPKCGTAYRLDHLLKENPEAARAQKCPQCKGSLTETRPFNLMMATHIGPSKRPGYLRPETAQGIYITFKRLYRLGREKLPLGAFQLGTSFRNEISPRQGLLRLREFHMAEAEVFVHPDEKEEHPRFAEVEGVPLRLVDAQDREKTMTSAEAVSTRTLLHQTLAYHMARVQQLLLHLGIPQERLRFRQHRKDELAHYALDCWDAEVQTKAYGWVEVVGIADRGDYDLTRHSKQSGEPAGVFIPYPEPQTRKVRTIRVDKKAIGQQLGSRAAEAIRALSALPPEKLRGPTIQVQAGGQTCTIDPKHITIEEKEQKVTGETITPHVIEPSYGLDRILYSLLELNHREEQVEEEPRAVIGLPPHMAPVQAAVFPLLGNHPGLAARARELHRTLRQAGLRAEYDDSGAIGRRYRRQDEIGTPYCITIDHQSLEDGTATIRERDSMKQERTPTREIPGYIQQRTAPPPF
ncbi:MAG: glycine--tRNA ligase [Euryarchaeota archaeon]|nr:glycine--tRNA ligase [Euryarchaeota archaeon]